MRGTRRRTAVALLLVTATLLGALASIAGAALTQHGDLFLTFNGDLSPTSLPRHTLAPISVSVSGTVRTPPGTKPPPLRQIEIALNRAGHFETTGLPICHAAQIEGTSSAQALHVCRAALVGSGTYAAQASFPEQATFPAQGHILAFNGLNEGRQVILAQVYGTNPVPATSVMTFYIKHPKRRLRNAADRQPPPLAEPLRLRQADRADPTPHLLLPRPPSQLPLSRMRSARRPLGSPLSLRPRLDALRRRRQPRLDPDPQLHREALSSGSH